MAGHAEVIEAGDVPAGGRRCRCAFKCLPAAVAHVVAAVDVEGGNHAARARAVGRRHRDHVGAVHKVRLDIGDAIRAPTVGNVQGGHERTVDVGIVLVVHGDPHGRRSHRGRARDVERLAHVDCAARRAALGVRGVPNPVRVAVGRNHETGYRVGDRESGVDAGRADVGNRDVVLVGAGLDVDLVADGQAADAGHLDGGVTGAGGAVQARGRGRRADIGDGAGFRRSTFIDRDVRASVEGGGARDCDVRGAGGRIERQRCRLVGVQERERLTGRDPNRGRPRHARDIDVRIATNLLAVVENDDGRRVAFLHRQGCRAATKERLGVRHVAMGARDRDGLDIVA